MLDNMRRQGASVFLYLVFGLLIAIFVININPGSKSGEGSGCGTGGVTIVNVDGNKVGKTAYQMAYGNQFISDFMRMWGFKTTTQREYAAVELLIRRELLAQAAAEHGLRVTDDMVMEEIKKGHYFLGGMQLPVDGSFNPNVTLFDKHDDGTRTWNMDRFKNWVGGMNVTRNAYIEEQTRGMQAALMQELLLSSVRVSREEAKDYYLHSKNTVSYDVVRFEPSAYRAAMKLTDADIARYLSTHEDEVKARFKSDERTYKDVKPQLKLRQIFIAKAEEEKKDEPKPDDAGSGSAAGSGSGSGSAAGSGSGSAAKKPDVKKDDTAKKDDKKKDDKKDTAKKDDKKKPVGLPIAEAKAKLEAARRDIAAGKKKFSEFAAELSSDEAMKASGGDFGWQSADSPGFPDKSLNDAVKALKPGEMTAVIELADKGVYLIKVEDKRPVGDAKDLTYDQVKMEIAANLAKDAWSKEAAKRAAITALAEARKDKKHLSELFDESADDKQRRQIEELQKQFGGGMVPPPQPEEGPDEPMAWKPGDDGPAGSGSAGSGSAAKAGSGSAGSGSAAGTGSGSAGAGSGSDGPTMPTLPPPPAKPARVEPNIAAAGKELEITKDELPKFAEMPKPNIKHYADRPRENVLPGISKELVTVVFDKLAANTLAGQVYESDAGFVVLEVTTKGEATMDNFDKEAKQIMGRMRMQRAGYLIEDWLKARCEALAKDDKIKPAENLFSREKEVDDKGNPVAGYRPCMTFRR